MEKKRKATMKLWVAVGLAWFVSLEAGFWFGTYQNQESQDARLDQAIQAYEFCRQDHGPEFCEGVR